MQSQKQRSLYEVLDVSPATTPHHLRNAYLRLLVTAHPDKGGSTELFQAVQHAYAVLSDPYERAAYDEGVGIPHNRQDHHVSGAKTVTTKIGVTAVVHGESGPSAAWQPAAAPPATAATAGSCRAAEEDAEIAALTAEIQSLLSDGVINGAELQRALAELHTARGQLHLAAGRPHHAAFDAREALTACPAYAAAEEVMDAAEALLASEMSGDHGRGGDSCSEEEGREPG
jgi:hypothetical protein